MQAPFEKLLGNGKIKTYLLRILEKGTIPQSLLFAGPEGVGKALFAEEFARCLVDAKSATHPDIHHYFPEGKIGMHSIQSMREFSEAVYMAPFQSKKKVFIIHEAHRMLATGANALLKTFEEPAPDSVIILLTNVPEQLLATVLSRCQTIRFQPIPYHEIVRYLVSEKKMPQDAAEAAAARSKGSLGIALQGTSGELHPLRELLLDLFSQDALCDYQAIVQHAKEFGDQIEARMREEEALLQERRLMAYSEKPNAKVRQMIEKEVDGSASLKKASEARCLFELILSWHRDLHLLGSAGNPDLLLNPDFRVKLLQALQRGSLISIEKVEEAVSQAVLALERSTPLPFVFENLFLKLSTLRKGTAGG